MLQKKFNASNFSNEILVTELFYSINEVVRTVNRINKSNQQLTAECNYEKQNYDDIPTLLSVELYFDDKLTKTRIFNIIDCLK